MSRMLALLVAISACSTTKQSSAGYFVTDLQVQGSNLYVQRCDFGLTVGQNHGANAAIGVLSVLAIFGGGAGGGGSSKSARTTTTSCSAQHRGAL